MRLLLHIVAFIFLTQLVAAEPLASAKRLGKGRLSGKKYAEINCVEFLRAVLEEELGRSLNQVEADALLIRNLPQADLPALIAKEDPRIKGVQYALVDIIKQGKAIALDKAQPGDFVHFWKRSSEGKWEGHSAIIEKIEGNLASLFGSHQSLGGIGTAEYKLALKQSGDRKIYIARLTR